MTQLSADDRLAIHELLAPLLPRHRLRPVGRVHHPLHPDCVVDFGELMGVHEGHEGVSQLGSMIGGTGLFMRHLVTNVMIEQASAERADTFCYVLALTGSGPAGLMPTTGRYEDEVVKRDGRWLIRRRRAVIETPR